MTDYINAARVVTAPPDIHILNRNAEEDDHPDLFVRVTVGAVVLDLYGVSERDCVPKLYAIRPSCDAINPASSGGWRTEREEPPFGVENAQ